MSFQKVTSIPVTLTDAPVIVTDARVSNRFRVTIGGDRQLGNPTHPVNDGQQIVWEIVQDPTGGHVLTYDSQFVFGDQVTGVISTGANTRSFLTAIYDSGSNKWYVVGCVTNYA